MDENNNIDDIFRSKLDDLEMTPSGKNWDSISEQLSEKRAARLKKKTGFWLSAAALLLIFSYTAYRLLNQPSTTLTDAPQQTQKSIAPSITQPDLISHEEITPAATVPNTTEDNLNNNEDKNTPISESTPSPTPDVIQQSSSVIISEKQSAVSTEKIQSKDDGKNAEIATIASVTNKNTDKSIEAENLLETPYDSQNKTNTEIPVEQKTTSDNEPVHSNPHEKATAATIVAAAIVTSNTIAESTAKTTAQASGQKSASSNSVSNSSNTLSNSIEKNSTAADDNKLVQESNAIPINKESESSSVSEINEPIDENGSSKVDALTASVIASSNPDTAEVISETSPSFFKSVISHLSLEVYYTPEYAKTMMKVNDEYTGPASKNLDDYTNESSQYCYSAGINLRYDIGSRWSIISGIQSSSYAKTAVYNSISVIADSVYQNEFVNRPHGGNSGGGHHSNHGGGGSHGGPGGHGHPNPGNPSNPNSNHHYVIHTPCGSIDLDHIPPQANNSSNGDTIKVNTEINETVHFVNVPIMVRYSFGINKLSYFVEAGAALNYVTTDKVEVIVNDATSESNELNALSNMNYSLLFGFGANYNFYKGLSMFVRPSLRYSVTPINVDSPVKSYPYYLGLGAGIAIHF